MKSQKTSTYKLGKAIGVTPQMISLYKNGKCKPELDRAFEIGEYLNVPPEDLKWLFQNTTDIMIENVHGCQEEGNKENG